MTTSVLLSIFEMDGSQTMAAGGLFLFLSVVMVSVFTFVSIAVWTEARRKEREAYYKSEMLRRITEASGDGGRYVIEMMKEEDRIKQAAQRGKDIRMIEGMKIGGLINIAVGLTLALLIYYTSSNKAAWLVGLFPGLIGVAMMVYVYVFAPRSQAM